VSAATERTQWCFADQLGPHFVDDDVERVLLVEATANFRRRTYHRRKAHLILSALRHRAAAEPHRVRLVRAESYSAALTEFAPSPGRPLLVRDPTSFAARRFVRRLAAGEVDGVPKGAVDVLPERGFVATPQEFARWADSRGGRRLLMEDFYRGQRRRHGLLLEPDGLPAGGSWNFDADNRRPPPAGVTRLADAEELAEPWWPEEDEIDAEVRRDLERLVTTGVRFVGEDGPRRFAVTREEAVAALDRFVTGRLAQFGPYEDAMLAEDRWLAHSLLSVPLNLGLLDPLEVVREAEAAYRGGRAPLASVEGFIRQVVGWRDYIWHMYWYAGESYRDRNALDMTQPLPAWFEELDAGREVQARCLSDVLAGVREEGWTHHIPRLMVLSNWAAQRGYDPARVTDWFHTRFVDGYEWVMTANVIGMAMHADGGLLATKPYVAGGAYIDRMSDYCGGCRYNPKVRLGEDACPFTAGYWAYLARNAPALRDNPRMSRALAGLGNRHDLDDVVSQEAARGSLAP